jgi:hypothetical protein
MAPAGKWPETAIPETETRNIRLDNSSFSPENLKS